jgi:RNA polymerase sigma factor (sigma-70 family)
MTAPADWDVAGRSDAELASGAAAGDRVALAGIYDRYADRLHDFCLGMLRDREGAADCVQDTFCTAATGLAQLRDPDKLRPWLYAIARHQALGRIAHRRSERLYEELPDMASEDPGPDTLAARNELAELIAAAAGGLSDRDRAVLELTYRHGLHGPELAQALGVSTAAARTLTHRLRETIERALGALLVARRAHTNPNRCAALGAILAGWDGVFTVLIRKRIARHIDSCPTCEQDRAQLVTPAALLGAAPIFIPAPAWLRAHTLNRIQLTSAETAITSPGTNTDPTTGAADSRPPQPTAGRPPHGANHVAAIDQDRPADPHHRATRRLIGLVALFAATLITTVGLTIAWLHHQQNTPLTPTGQSAQMPPPTAPTSTTEPTPHTLPPAPTQGAVTTAAPIAPPAPQIPPHDQTPAPADPTAAPSPAPAAPGPAPAVPQPPLVPTPVVTPAITPTPPVSLPPVLIATPSAPILPPPPPRWPSPPRPGSATSETPAPKAAPAPATPAPMIG